MNFKEIDLDELLIAGFIEGCSEEVSKEEEISFSSWGEEEEVCPYCGEAHSSKVHSEIHWEESFLTHRLLKENIDELLKNKENVVDSSRKYEIIRYSTGINSEKYSFNLVGIKVKDLNKVPFGFSSMRFPKKRYLSISTTMDNFHNLSDLDVIHSRDDLEDYFIIEYDLLSKAKFSDLEVTIYYPLRES